MGCGPFFVYMDRRHYNWVEQVIAGLGFEFVHLEWGGRSGLLRVYIDKPQGIGLEDCAFVSEHLSRAMSVEGIPYGRLEISSPGLDRPLVKERDFIRFTGQIARIVLRVPMSGRKNFTGKITGVCDGVVSLTPDGGDTVMLQFANIDKARLVPQL
jgi:ribosome maturation factor RimP